MRPSPTRSSASLLVLALATTMASSCITMQVPERFLVVDSGGSHLKAITPEESKLWLRDFDDGDRGGLAFWRDALRADLKDNRGYVVISEAEVKDAAGTPGYEMVLESTVNGRPVRELLALFVYGGWLADRIRVVEYVAEKETFEREVAGVRASLATIRP
jgi:hypothetical protein